MSSVGHRPSALWRVARSTPTDRSTPWAPSSRGISRMPRVGSFHNATTREASDAFRPGALDHPERREGQHRRAGIVGEHAGVAGGPARRQLGSVEEDRDDERRPDGTEQLGDSVEAGEVLTHDGDERDPATELEELDRAAGNLHRLPPAQGRDRAFRRGGTGGSGSRRATSDGACSGGSATSTRRGRRRGAPSCRAGRPPSVRCPGPRPPARRPGGGRGRLRRRRPGPSGTALSGSTTMSTTSTSSRAAARTRSSMSRSNRSAGSNSKKPNGSRSARLADASTGRKSLSLTRNGHGSKRMLARLAPRIESRPLGRDLVPHGGDTGTAHTCVASEGAQGDAAGGREHLRQHAHAGAPDACQRSGAGEQLASPTAQRAARCGCALDGDAHRRRRPRRPRHGA